MASYANHCAAALTRLLLYISKVTVLAATLLIWLYLRVPRGSEAKQQILPCKRLWFVRTLFVGECGVVGGWGARPGDYADAN